MGVRKDRFSWFLTSDAQNYFYFSSVQGEDQDSTYPQKQQLCLPPLCWLVQSWSPVSVLSHIAVLSSASPHHLWSSPPPHILLMSWHRLCPTDTALRVGVESGQPRARWALIKLSLRRDKGERW